MPKGKSSTKRGRRGYKRMSLDKSCKKPVNFKCTYLVTQWVGGGVGAFGHFAYAPKLADLPNAAEYVALFDQYKIRKCVFTFEPCFTGNDINGIVNAGPANAMSPFIGSYIRVVKDYDDSVILTSEDDYFEYDNLISFPCFGKSKKITLYLKIKLDADGLQDISSKPPWIDLDNINVDHFGIKTYAPITNTVSQYIECRVICTIYFSCKNRM